MAADTPYVAPARYVLTVLHRQDPRDLPVMDPATAEYVDGWTRCGKPMLQSELWRPVDGRDGDSLCTGCMLPGSSASGPAPDATEQGTLL